MPVLREERRVIDVSGVGVGRYMSAMNWTWELRSEDGGANGIEFARCTTVGGIAAVLVHAAPSRLGVSICDETGAEVASSVVVRDGEYSPMTLLMISGSLVERQELWLDDDFLGTPVLLAGGEAGLLTAWQHERDRSWWRWSVEFSNHRDRPSDWSPPTDA